MKSYKEKYGDWALIAGASEGIGRAFAEQIAQQGINLILISRRKAVLEDLKQNITKNYNVEVVIEELDLTDPSLQEKIDRIAKQYDVGMLVYNAGAVHGASTFLEDSTEKLLSLIRLNCVGPVLMVKAFGQQMKDKGRGGIILLSSMSALSGGAYIATYAATKAFDLILAESLWDELRGFGVDVLGLVAGATVTPAMLNSGVKFLQDAEGQEGISPMQPSEVASEALANLGIKPVHVAGAQNIDAANGLRSASDRAETIQYMGKAAASLYGKSYPLKP